MKLLDRSTRIPYIATLLLLSFTLSNVVAKPSCIFGNVIIDSGFEMGNIAECRAINKKKFVLTVEPEHKPINKSPWYAFSISSVKKQTVEILLHYAYHSHRYPPKISYDREIWGLVAEQQYSLLHNNKVLKLKLDIDSTPTYIAGQEIIDNGDYFKWLRGYRDKGYKVTTIGKSVQGRNIAKLVSIAKTDAWLLVAGRQHPPEVTGAIALMNFMNTVLEDTILTKEFREKVNILLVPNLNPDGVSAGNWRYSANNVDLNRDWGVYEQPEIKLVKQEIDAIYANKQKLVLALDFHSTNKDVLYTQKDNAIKTLPMFTNYWHSAINKRLPNYNLLRTATHNPGLPTFKTFLSKEYDIPAIIYEQGDDTDRTVILKSSKIAAEEMMRLLLEAKL